MRDARLDWELHCTRCRGTETFPRALTPVLRDLANRIITVKGWTMAFARPWPLLCPACVATDEEIAIARGDGR